MTFKPGATMHTLMVLGGGFALLAALIVIGRASKFRASTAAMAFIPVWFVCAAVNMWVGVTRAGYTVAQEFPIFLGVFCLPGIAAMLIWWRNAA